jgi:ribosomal protein S27E
MSKLTTLEDHNKVKYFDQVKAIATFGSPIYYRNGIQCPKCGEELVDSHGHTILFSQIPQYSIKCVKGGCGFTGLRY